jgi:hypothetical protein
MRESLNVGKSSLKLRVEFEDALGLMDGAQAFGDLGGIYIRAVNNSYGLHRQHDLSSANVPRKSPVVVD